MERGGYVYIITNTHHTTLYVGMTSNLLRRIQQHKQKYYPKSFSARYNLHKLVYYEVLPNIQEAIAREKQLKCGNRKKKEMLIVSMNADWNDLWEEIKHW